MELQQSAPLFARLCCLDRQPGGEFFSVGIELAGARTLGVAGLFIARPQVLLNGVASQACTPGDLAHGHLLAQCPAS